MSLTIKGGAYTIQGLAKQICVSSRIVQRDVLVEDQVLHVEEHTKHELRLFPCRRYRASGAEDASSTAKIGIFRTSKTS
jgi:hypothetical protein